MRECMLSVVARVKQIFIIGVLVALIIMQIGCGGCGVSDIADAMRQTNAEFRNAVNSFDRAIYELSNQSSNWQVTLQNLEKSLMSDAQSTIRVEVTNLLQTSLLATGEEFRGNAEYLSIHTERELRRIRNDLARLANRTGINPPIELLPEIPVEPYICGVVPTAIDTNLDADRRTKLDVYGFDLRSLLITVETVGLNQKGYYRDDVTRALSIISDQHMVLNLSDNGIKIDKTSNLQRIVFSWNNKPQSTIPILLPQPVTLRRTIVSIPTSRSSDDFRPPNASPELDGEFDGHGPKIWYRLNLIINPERTELTAKIYMRAKEKVPDDEGPSLAEGTKYVTLFRIQMPEDRIVRFDVDPNFPNRDDPNDVYEYIDTNHDSEDWSFGGLSPVEKLVFTGDTNGDDIGETGVITYFRQINVQVERFVP